MTLSDDQQAAYHQAHEWNAENPVGSPVLAWPGTREQDPLRTRTRSSAWVLDSGHVLVSVDGYAGGIHLDHVEPDPTRQPAVPDVEFPSPPCPICGAELDHDGNGFVCLACRASWSSNGQRGNWDDPSGPRCLAVRTWNHPALDVERCVLAAHHDIDRTGRPRQATHRTADGLGAWTDRDAVAVIDSEGNPLP